MEYCRLHEILIQAWAPLAGGILTGKAVERPSAAMVAAGSQVRQLAEEKNVSHEAVLIAWLLRHPARFQPIIGTTKPERVRAACQAKTVELTREEWYMLFTAGRGAPLP